MTHPLRFAATHNGPTVARLMSRLPNTNDTGELWTDDTGELWRVKAILDGVNDDTTADNEDFTYGARLWDNDLVPVTVLYPIDLQPGYVLGVPSGPVVIWWATTNGMADGSRLALRHPRTRQCAPDA